jgi:hypothetical protein
VTRPLQRGSKAMRGRILRCLVHATLAGLMTALIVVAVPSPIESFAANPSTPGEEQPQTDQDRCKFLMENVNATILASNVTKLTLDDMVALAAYAASP